MRISDWSSDVCSSDLPAAALLARQKRHPDRQRLWRLAGPLYLHRAFEGAVFLEPAVNFVVGGAHKFERSYLEVGRQVRSEEHTSELQSLMRISYAVFCLKKKNKKNKKKKRNQKH